MLIDFTLRQAVATLLTDEALESGHSFTVYRFGQDDNGVFRIEVGCNKCVKKFAFERDDFALSLMRNLEAELLSAVEDWIKVFGWCGRVAFGATSITGTPWFEYNRNTGFCGKARPERKLTFER